MAETYLSSLKRHLEVSEVGQNTEQNVQHGNKFATFDVFQQTISHSIRLWEAAKGNHYSQKVFIK